MTYPSAPATSPLALPAAHDPRSVLFSIAVGAVFGLVAAQFPQYAAPPPGHIPTSLHTLAETFYVGGATAIFCIAWYSPHSHRPLRSTLLACICASVALLTVLHQMTLPGMPDANSTASARFASLAQLALPLMLLPAALIPDAKLISPSARWSLLVAALGLTLLLAWHESSAPTAAGRLPGTGVIAEGLLRETVIAACILAAYFSSRRRRHDDPVARHVADAAVLAAFAEACFAFKPAAMDVSTAFAACGHTYGLLTLNAMFFAVYADAVDAPYRAVEQARLKAQTDKERIETIVRCIADGVVVVDSGLQVASVNPVATRLFGVTAAEHQGSSLQALLQVVDGAASIFDHVKDCLRDGIARTPQEYTELRSHDGLVSTVEYSISPLCDPSGRVQGSVLVLRDVTTRKAMEELLVRREAKFRTLAENSPDFIVRYDRNCRCLYLNAAYENFAGAPAHDILQKTPMEAAPLPVSQARALQDMIAGVVASRLGADLNLSWQRQHGEFVSFSVQAVPEFDDAGRVTSVLSVARDVTAMKHTERSLRESRAQLRELSARREEVSENERKRIAHKLHEELGQTLTALRITISTLSLQYSGQIPNLQERTRLMLGLVDQTIDGIRTAVTSLRPTSLDAGLAVGLEWLVDAFQTHTSIACFLHMPAEDLNLDDAHATASFRIVQEALTNIARHAGATRADVTLQHEQKHFLLKICDNGCGFDAWRPLDGGSGIHDMWERTLMLNGEFLISSSRGLGTVIRVLFPQAAATCP